MEYFTPLLCPEFIRAYNYLEVSAETSSRELWQKAQMWCLCLANYCAENQIPPELVGFIYAVERRCDNYQQAAFLAAANVVEAYQEAFSGEKQ